MLGLLLAVGLSGLMNISQIKNSRPEKTSFGAVSMQLLNAARTLGLDESKNGCPFVLTVNCLQHHIFNIQLVADIFIN
ncbi:hypothetical protein ACLB1M_04960 [Escherichia coli]